MLPCSAEEPLGIAERLFLQKKLEHELALGEDVASRIVGEPYLTPLLQSEPKQAKLMDRLRQLQEPPPLGLGRSLAAAAVRSAPDLLAARPQAVAEHYADARRQLRSLPGVDDGAIAEALAACGSFLRQRCPPDLAERFKALQCSAQYAGKAPRALLANRAFVSKLLMWRGAK